MSDRLDFIERLNGFMASDHIPTSRDIELFVRSLSEEDRVRFLCSLLRDGLSGMRPPKRKAAQA